METLQYEKTESSFEPQDKQDFYKVEEIDGTIFKKAESDLRTVYLLGENIIADAQTEKERKEIEKGLKTMNTRLLVPLVAAIIQLIQKTETYNQKLR
nr:MAG: hypothetical protein [Microviridae sp.]